MAEDETTEETPIHESFVQRWGSVIVTSGGEYCKGGAYSYPGALDRYERALGLKPAESWLMKRILSYDWTGKRYVFFSFHKLSKEADISYGELLNLKEALENKGYIKDMGQHSNGTLSQVHDYSFDGFISALEHAIQCDPESTWGKSMAERRGHKITMADFFSYADGPRKGKPFEPYAAFTTPKEVNNFHNANGHIPSWGGIGGLSIPKPAKRKQRELICECGKTFKTASTNPYTRCLTCRRAHKRLSLKALVTK